MDLKGAEKISDYVDIHGRDLHVLIDNNGSIYVPLDEIRKTGFHIYPKIRYNRMLVGPQIVVDEFNKYLLGAAMEYLINNQINYINSEEIMQNIEKCHEKLFSKNSSKPQQITSPNSVNFLENSTERHASPSNSGVKLFSEIPNTSPCSSVFGRTLLSDPREIKKQVVNTSFSPNKLLQNDAIKTNVKPFMNISKFDKNPSFMNNNVSKDHSGSSNSSTDDVRNSSYSNQRNRKSNNENDAKLDHICLESLQLASKIKMVKVVHVERNAEKEKYWVHLTENEQIIDEILLKCNTACDSAPSKKPQVGETVLAKSLNDNTWYRAFVRRVYPAIKVLYVDFGNEEVIREIKELPKELKAIPAQGIRFVLSKPENQEYSEKFNINDILSLLFIKKYLDTTWLVKKRENVGNRLKSISNLKTAPPVQNFSPVVLKNIKYSNAIQDGDTVHLVAYSDGKFYLHNAATYKHFREFAEQIKELPQSPLKKVEVGQVVLCKKPNEEALCRAIVNEVRGVIIIVFFIDFHETKTEFLDNLYGISKEIALFPPTLLESPTIKGFKPGELSQDAKSILDDIIKRRDKLQVSFKTNIFDLTCDKQSLSEILFPIEKVMVDLSLKPAAQSVDVPKQRLPKVDTSELIKNEVKSEVTHEKVFFDQMKVYETPLGVEQYLLTSYINPGEFTVSSTDEIALDYLSKCIVDVDQNDEPFSDAEVGDMCLAQYSGEWFRGVISDVDENYNILFVDYGNYATVPPTGVRRFPRELADIPIMGLMCSVKVPNTEAVQKRLKELLTPDKVYEINMISYDKQNYIYEVDIPEVKKILLKENLMSN